jgi:hypothetical protein
LGPRLRSFIHCCDDECLRHKIPAMVRNPTLLTTDLVDYDTFAKVVWSIEANAAVSASSKTSE